MKRWLLFFLLTVPALAQLASITGVVADRSGLPIGAAVVNITNNETGLVRNLVTDDAGRYSAPGLAVGQYQVTASKDGFRSARKTGVTLVVGQEMPIDLTLEVGEVHDTVTVESEPNQVNLSTEQVSGLVGERQVKDLPLNGRSYDELMTLNPGVVNYTSQRSGGDRHVESVGGQHVRGLGAAAAGESVPAERDRVHRRVGDQHHSGRRQRPASGRGRGARIQRGHRYLRRASTASGPARRSASSRLPAPTSCTAAVYEFLRNSALDARNLLRPGLDSAIPAQRVRRRAGRPDPEGQACSSSATTRASASTWD